MESYNRPAVCCKLDEFDKLYATESDYIEICKWKNGNGYDIAINDRHYSLTIGELDAIIKLTEYLKSNK